MKSITLPPADAKGLVLALESLASELSFLCQDAREGGDVDITAFRALVLLDKMRDSGALHAAAHYGKSKLDDILDACDKCGGRFSGFGVWVECECRR